MKQITQSLQVMLQALAEWWHSWLVLAVLNTLVVVCWITVILGPPATFGLYYAVHSLVKTQSTDWRELAQGARLYFVKSWIWMLLNIAVALLTRISIEFYSRFTETTILMLLTLMLAFVWFYTQFYALPYLMRQEQKNLFLAMRNGLLTLFASPLYTLILMLLIVVVLWISMSFPILLIIGSPALIAMLGTIAVDERLRTFNIVQEPPLENEM